MPIFDYDSKDRKKIRDRTRTGNADYRLEIVGADPGAFSFLAVGDTGDGDEASHPQFEVARAMADERDVEMVLHLGDVVYLSGSKEGYHDRFIRPFQAFLRDGTKHRWDDMVFARPFLPVYGNHDYYDFHDLVPLLGSVAGRLSERLGSGSGNGEVFERAFVERRRGLLVNGRMLYDPSAGRTRIPNRYYWFTRGPAAFFALDSNTLEGLRAVPDAERDRLRLQRALARERAGYLENVIKRYRNAVKSRWVSRAEVEDELASATEELVESLKEADALDDAADADERHHDRAQLEWLRAVLAHPDARDRWKIVYLHHPLYTSARRHTDAAELHGLRENLRELLVEAGVHLVLSGHSHCFEWVARRAGEAAEEAPRRLAEAERRICYVVSGGGGRDLEASILERSAGYDGEDLRLRSRTRRRLQFLQIAESRAWAALRRAHPESEHTSAVYHFLRVDVTPERLEVRPVGVEEREGSLRRLEAFPVLRLEEPEPRPEATLRCIRVFRDREPEGVWGAA